jgi:hypothetical protein
MRGQASLFGPEPWPGSNPAGCAPHVHHDHDTRARDTFQPGQPSRGPAHYLPIASIMTRARDCRAKGGVLPQRSGREAEPARPRSLEAVRDTIRRRRSSPPARGEPCAPDPSIRPVPRVPPPARARTGRGDRFPHSPGAGSGRRRGDAESDRCRSISPKCGGFTTGMRPMASARSNRRTRCTVNTGGRAARCGSHHDLPARDEQARAECEVRRIGWRGGAFLEFLEDKKPPAIAVLEARRRALATAEVESSPVPRRALRARNPCPAAPRSSPRSGRLPTIRARSRA